MIDELEKIGASMRQAGYMQSRRGTRPYRVDTLLSKSNSPGYVEPNTVTQSPEMDQPPPAQLSHDEDEGDPAVGKTAAAPEPLTERAMEGVAKARPYVVSGIKAGIPAALFGKMMVGEGPKGSHAARIAGIAGAGLGVANEAMKRWAEKHKQKALAKKILDTGRK